MDGNLVEIERLHDMAARLADSVGQLTRERDEALAEVERLRDLKNRILSDLTVVIRERDEALAENERLRDTLSDEIRFSAERIARLQVERDGLREALNRNRE